MTQLLAVLLGVILGLSMVVVGSRAGVGLTVEGTALRDCVGGDQASNQDQPGQPPPRLLDAELEDSEDDSDDDRSECAELSHALFELSGARIREIAFLEASAEAIQRAREGHGARGPPLA